MSTEGTLEVFYSSSEDIGGFQFGLDGATAESASGGAAADAGFTITVGSQLVLGFSFNGDSIPAGEGLLTTLSLASYSAASDACLSGIVVSSPDASGLEFTAGTCVSLPCDDADADATCDHTDDCVGDYDCAGECNGASTTDNCGTCDSDDSNDLSLIHI